MAHITLSIPDVIFKEMKQHPEVKWSEVARQSITTKLSFFKNSMHSKDLFRLLPLDTQESIKKSSEREDIELTKKILKKRKERVF